MHFDPPNRTWRECPTSPKRDSEVEESCYSGWTSIPVELEQADHYEMEGLSPRDDTLNVTETMRAGEVERSGSSKDENQLKEEALINAVIEIEALMMMAAQAANDRSEQGREVPSEVEDLHQTKGQRIVAAFNFSDTDDDSSQRSIGLTDLERFGAEDAFDIIARAFDDQSEDIRNAAASALFELQPGGASFARMFREGSPDRRRRIAAAIAASGLASNAIANLTGQTREQGYEAFSLLFLMTKAGEVQPLMQAVEDHPNIEVRLAVVKLLALNGQPEMVPSFRQLAVRAVLPLEVRTAVIEAIYELGRQLPRDILSGGRLGTDTK